MSCEPHEPRSRSGRLALGALAVVAVFHLGILTLVASPNIDETYRRTYVTGEFSIYPAAAPFATGDGLDYSPGHAVQLGPEAGRKYLARFDWRRWDLPVPNIGAFSGRLFLHVTAGPPPGRRAHRLRLGLTCRLPPGEEVRLEASMNDVPLGFIVCAHGPVEVDLVVRAGLLGSRRYDEITITRPSDGLADDIRTRLALRHDAVGLDWFGIDVAGLGPVARDGPHPTPRTRRHRSSSKVRQTQDCSPIDILRYATTPEWAHAGDRADRLPSHRPAIGRPRCPAVTSNVTSSPASAGCAPPCSAPTTVSSRRRA